MSVSIRYGCGHELNYPCLLVATMRDPLEMNCPACLGILWPDQIADAWLRGDIKKWKECATDPIFDVQDPRPPANSKGATP